MCVSLYAFPSLPEAGNFITAQPLTPWASSDTRNKILSCLPTAKSKCHWKPFLMVGMDKKHAKFMVSISL